MVTTKKLYSEESEPGHRFLASYLDEIADLKSALRDAHEGIRELDEMHRRTDVENGLHIHELKHDIRMLENQHQRIVDERNICLAIETVEFRKKISDLESQLSEKDTYINTLAESYANKDRIYLDRENRLAEMAEALRHERQKFHLEIAEKKPS